MKRIRIISIIMALSLACFFVLTACGEPAEPVQTVNSIAITTLPKTEYSIGEALDLTGGVLTVTYSDQTTATVALTDSSVTVTRPDMSSAGAKTVEVSYGGKTASFGITVANVAVGYTVTFEFNDANATAAEKRTVNAGEKVTPPAAPSRAGYDFLGWFKTAEAEEEFDFGTAITSDLTLYAGWRAYHTLTFDYNYEEAAPATVKVYADEVTVRPAQDPMRDNYIFRGWFAEAEGVNEYVFGAPLSADVTVYAKWEELGGRQSYTVTFDYNYSAGPEDRTVQVLEDETVAEPQAPTRRGAVFEGWFVDEAGSEEYRFSDPVTGDLTLYAKWTVTELYVIFYLNDGTDAEYQALSVPVSGGRIARPADPPAREGFYFGGWYLDAEGAQTFNFSTTVTEETHLYALWLKMWTFEAEYTYIHPDTPGFGFSENQQGPAIIDPDTSGANASNGYYISYLYYNGATITFEIESDAEVTNAVLVLRLSVELIDMYFDDSNYGIYVNGTELKGYAIDLSGALTQDQDGINKKRPFENYEVATGVHLVKGTNKIELVVENEDHPFETGTMQAFAPMVDCIYLCTNANLSWEPHEENLLQA